MPLCVLISHSGKTVELEVGPHARVEAVQQTLADLTGIPLSDQILMCEGARLDAAKPLSAYGLPGADRAKVHDLFLYSRAHLRADAPSPPAEQLPECLLDLSGLDAIRQQRHRLDSAGSPLLRALPDYQRQFQEHLLQASARHEVSQQRMACCTRLVSEQEVQALSIDAATANVEVHYAYICDAYGAFAARYQQQAAAHAEVLSRFESDLQYLAATELHPALRGSTSSTASSIEEGATGSAGASGAGAASGSTHERGQDQPASLLGLVNAPALREVASAASRGHQHFAGKVAELEALFGTLKADVEALFMQAPSVDLEALTHQLEEMHGQVDEQASIVAALSSDLSKVHQLVEQAGEQAAGDSAASVQVSDTVHMLETMHETHVGHLLPRVAACHEAVEAFAARCLECKNALTRDVFTQLRTISSQQSKIREMKNKLALFREALARQDGAVQELLVVRRVPAAYKQCLAECVRRGAFMEKYAHSAAALAERMGAFRGKELAMRESFRKHVERLIPATLLERMGLLEQPPHCQVSVAASEGERLLAVTVDDVRRIQLPWAAPSALAATQQQQAQQQQRQPGTPTSATAAGFTGSAGAEELQQQQAQQEGAGAGAEVDVTASLQLENARLRAELASAIALDCIRAAQLASVAGLGATAGAASAAQRGAAPAGGGASGQASPHLALSAASSPRSAAAASGLAGAGSAVASAMPPALPPEAAQRFERALSAKDGLVAELQAQLAASRQQSATYEARIQHLESQLAVLAAAADGRTPAGAQPSGRLGHSTATTSGAVSFSHPVAVAGSSSGASDGSPAASALPAAPVGAARQQQVELPLAASVDAAIGSSLAGHMHAPDVSRSLGPSTSQPAGAQPQQQWRQAERQSLDAARSPAAGEEQEGPSPTEQWTAVGSASPGGDGASRAETSSGNFAPTQAAASQGTLPPEQDTAGDIPEAPPACEGAAQGHAPHSSAASAGAHAPADPEAEASASEVEAPCDHNGMAAADAAEPSPEAEPAADSAAAATDALPAPPPHPLLSSLMAGEGSDVEGIEPVSDSDSDDQPGDGAGEVSGSGSPEAAYGSAQSGLGSPESAGARAQAADEVAAAAGGEEHETSMPEL